MRDVQKKPIHLVWLKRDLRLSDHRPIWEACQQGVVLVLYVFEPKLWSMPEMDRSHFDFIIQSLNDLMQRLSSIGGRLALRVGELPEVFTEIAAAFDIAALYSHEETGNGFTYSRDKNVAKWSTQQRIPWLQFPQNGVVRPLKSRNGWADLWQKRMRAPLAPAPSSMVIPSDFDWGQLPEAERLGLGASPKTNLQVGGELKAKEVLDSFLTTRGFNYRKGMSSPVSAHQDCSRLSPYLAWGCISMKSAYQSMLERQEEVREAPAGSFDSRWAGSLSSFSSRLAWHCHFMQKLEDEPELEFQNISRVYDGLRENDFNQERFEAWKEGRTGYPMIDACMRALHQRSWINFRMRAMLVSFASNHLWLHWRPTAVYLAKHFLDFEPGIHFSQCQMQSGTTGINTIRIYSPAKQVIDHDPTGAFIRQYVPELANVPDQYLPEPHRMPIDLQSQIGCIVGSDYPFPIVEHRQAYKSAQEKIFAIRQTGAAIDDSKRVFVKHGSRKKRDPLPKPKKASEYRQLSLFDDGEEIS
jgi:deoxyribodipyrimidine photo-lyase